MSAEGVVAGLDLLILLDGADVDIAQSAYLAPQIGHLRPEDVHVLELHTELFGLREGQLILVPELRGHLVVFALGGGFPLRQTGHLAAHLFPLIGGGAALYFFKFKKPKADTKGGDELDEYDFGEDEDDEDEPTPEDEEPAQDKEE